MSRVLTKDLDVNIHKVNIVCEDDIFMGTFDLRVHDREDLQTIIDELKKLEGLQDVTTN